MVQGAVTFIGNYFLFPVTYFSFFYILLCRGVVVLTTAQLHSTKPELRFCVGSNPARGISKIHDGEDL